MRPQQRWALRAYESADKLQFEEVELPTLGVGAARHSHVGTEPQRGKSTGLGCQLRDQVQEPEDWVGGGVGDQRPFASPFFRAEEKRSTGFVKALNTRRLLTL